MGLQRALFLCPLLLRFLSVGAGSQELEAPQLGEDPSPSPPQPPPDPATRQPPVEWMAAIAQSDKLWAFNESSIPTLGRYQESVLPLLGNGMVGWQIGDPNLYVSGVFNGQSSAGMNRATQRAAVPAGLGAFAVDAPGSAQSDAALDMREAVYYRRSTLPPSTGCSASSISSCTTSPVEVTVEQRWYAHQTLPSALVMEVAVLSSTNGSARPDASSTTYLKVARSSYAAVNSTDINFTAHHTTVSGARMSVGWTQIAETPSRDSPLHSNLTQVGVLSSDVENPSTSGGLWAFMPGHVKAFLTIVRTSLETKPGQLDEELEADFNTAQAMATNGTLQVGQPFSIIEMGPSSLLIITGE